MMTITCRSNCVIDLRQKFHFFIFCIVGFVSLLHSGSQQLCFAYSVGKKVENQRPLSQIVVNSGKVDGPISTRRTIIKECLLSITSPLIIGSVVALFPIKADAKADCYSDCFKNCKALVPKDLAYCQVECTDYCNQPDRADGLSGSVSYEKGEVGILGGTFGSGTVVKGEDKPPTIKIPGLDFSSGDGKKLIEFK